MTSTIRPATADDAATIVDYNSAMARETEALELDRERLLAGVRAVLDDPGKGFYVIAEVEGRIVGQLLVTFEWSDWRNGAFWWIQSVYVHPEYRGQGVFRHLYLHVAERAEAEPSICGLRLYVENENHRAQRTYKRVGMRRTTYQLYEVDFVVNR